MRHFVGSGAEQSARGDDPDQLVVGVHDVEVDDPTADLVVPDVVERLGDGEVGPDAGGVRSHVLGDGVAEDLADGWHGALRVGGGFRV